MAGTSPAVTVNSSLTKQLAALAVIAALAFASGSLLARQSPVIAVAGVAALALCVAALLRPAHAFVAVAFALPFYHLATAEVLPGLRLTLLELAGALLLARVLLPAPRPLIPPLRALPTQFWLLAGMLVWATASSAMSPFGEGNLVNSVKPFSAALVFWLLTFTFGRKAGTAHLLLIALIVGATLAQAVGLPQSVTKSPIVRARILHVTEELPTGGTQLEEVRVAGLMGDPNMYAFASVAVLPLCLAGLLSGRRKWLWAIAAGVIAVALVVSYSRGAFVAAAAGFVWYVMRASRTRHRALLVLAGVALVGAFVAPRSYVRRMKALATGQWDESIRWRIEAWQYALLAVRDHPLLGVGPGHIREVNPRTMYPHDTYLDIGAGLGIPGLLALLAILGLSVRDAARARANRRGMSRVMLIGVEAAIVAAAVFWVFFSMFPNKLPWFMMALAAASAREVGPQATAAPSEDSEPAAGRSHQQRTEDT